MVKVVICNGMPMSGKTTFQTICKGKSNHAHGIKGYRGFGRLHIESCSTVDFVKEVAKSCGWDGTKTLENRKFLSDLKDLLSQWDDVPYQKVKHKIDICAEEDVLDWLFFVDSREPEEIERFKREFNATTVLIRRESVENIETSNHADAEVFNCNYDLTIWNNSDIMNLENEVERFLEYMKGAPYYEYDN